MKRQTIDHVFNLNKKTIILTGSAGRLGTNFAHVLSSVGANVILIDINKKENKELEKSISKKYKTNPFACNVDITKKDELVNLSSEIIKKYGKIDGLVNNAFFSPRIDPKKSAKKFEEYQLDLWNKVLSVNLTGVFLCCQEFGKKMVKQKDGGVIVNISSIYGINGADQRIYENSELNSPPSYAASKGAIVNFTRYLASYWNKKNIRVNTMTLGGVLDTSYMTKKFIKKYSDKTILGRMAEKDEYNGALLFLLSKASSYMTGANLILDGGWSAW
jgi:NAD(P)-dependent dehydrogenase (short-subunit alcohol dehydrogenase family)|tara:strand:+ start:6567 stop:7388 length:822 start_codon:yes stop_codon:yes gene_type:complete